MPLLGPDGQPLSEVPPADAEAVPEAPEPVPCVAAFVVAILPDGKFMAYDSLDIPLVPERGPSLDEMYAGCAVVQKDIASLQTAMEAANPVSDAVVSKQMQVAQAVAQQRNVASAQQKIEADKLRRRGGR